MQIQNEKKEEYQQIEQIKAENDDLILRISFFSIEKSSPWLDLIIIHLFKYLIPYQKLHLIQMFPYGFEDENFAYI